MIWHGIASVRRADSVRVALVLNEGYFDLAETAGVLGVGDRSLTRSVDELLQSGPRSYSAIEKLAELAAESLDRLESLNVGPHDVAAPFRPERLFCAAANYAEHAREMGTRLADKSERRPYMFIKPGSAVIGHNDAILLPPESSQVDWEIELGAVIGREARNVGLTDALGVIAGYTIVNDVTARDLNVRDDYPFGTDWLRGKCFDTFAPMGPCFVPAGCIEDPHDLHMQLAVNDTVMQDSTTAAMIFDIREQVAYLSGILTLHPGDVIATGTPTGVGMAYGTFLQPGDVITATIESIGTLVNSVATG